MIPPLDPFALEFDSIEIDPTRAPSPAAIERALALAAPTAAAPEAETSRPGFYLLNDAHGRFVVDHEIGVISLKDEELVESEHGAVYTVRLRVIEPSGASYDIDMPLRITGRVPQLVGGEAFALPAETPSPAASARAVAPPPVPWPSFAAVRGAGAPAPISCCGAAPYGGVLQASLPAAEVSFVPLVLAEPTPPPAPRHAVWLI
jgi:hypothetical protein